MEVSLARKKELQEQDSFHQYAEKVLDTAKKYRVQIIAAVVAIVVLWASVTFYLYYNKTQEAKAFTALQKVSAQINPTDGEIKDKDKLFEISKKGYESVIAEFSGTIAGKMAMVKLGDILFEKKDYEGAIKQYENALDGFSGTSLENLILSSLAISYEQKKDLANAEKNFLKIAGGSSEFKKDEAYYHLGMIYQKNNKSNESKEMFKKVSKDSFYYQMVQDKL